LFFSVPINIFSIRAPAIQVLANPHTDDAAGPFGFFDLVRIRPDCCDISVIEKIKEMYEILI